MVLSRILPAAMRLLAALGLVLVCMACTGPNSTGALWSQENVDRERELFRLGEAQRAAQAQAFELSLADEQLASERNRIEAALQACPGPRQPLAVSVGDTVRDSVRIRSQADQTRLSEVGNLALADWYTRRASATGSSDFCQRARLALDGGTSPRQAGQRDILAGLPVVVVTRNESAPISDVSDPQTALSAYVLGYVDAVRAPPPLPQYLAAVYGGTLEASSPMLDAETAQAEVDQSAPAHAEWEPDALYAALAGGFDS